MVGTGYGIGDMFSKRAHRLFYCLKYYVPKNTNWSLIYFRKNKSFSVTNSVADNFFSRIMV